MNSMNRNCLWVSVFLLYCPLFVYAQNWTLLGSPISGNANFLDTYTSVSVNGDGSVIAIGSGGSGDGNISNTGEFKVYQWNNGVWQLKGDSIHGSTHQGIGDMLGISVKLDSAGDILAVGAGAWQSVPGSSGYLLVYHWDGSQWQVMGDTLFGNQVGDRFGSYVDISPDGKTVAASAPYRFDPSIPIISASGANAYLKVYHWNGNTWQQKGATFQSPDSLNSIGSDFKLADSGNSIVFNALSLSYTPQDSDYVYNYQWNGTSWEQKGPKFSKPVNEFFGIAIDLSEDGNTLLISDPVNLSSSTSYNNFQSGKVLIYHWNNSQWVLESEIDGTYRFENLGTSISLNAAGDKVVIANQDSLNFDGGGWYSAVRAYSFDGNAWSQSGDSVAMHSYPIFAVNNGDRVSSDLLGNRFAVAHSLYTNMGGVEVYGNDNSNTGLKLPADMQVKVFPNPTNSDVQITLSTAIGNCNITQYDISGREILQSEFRNQGKISFEVSGTLGLYFLKITSSGFQKTIPIVKD